MKPQLIIIESGIMQDKPQKNRPVIAIMTGDGVIEKPSALCDRVLKSDDFYWSRNGETIAFVRKKDLEIENLIFLKVAVTVDESLRRECEAIYDKEYHNIRNETVLRLIRRQMTPYLLGGMLILLIANFFINRTLTDKNSTLQQELSIKRKSTEKQRQQNDNEQKLLSGIHSNRSQKISTVLDKIASRIPNETTLTLLSIDPLIRSPENRKPLQINRNTIVIKGISDNVSSLTHALSDILNDIKIKKIEQQTFEIEARL